MPSTETIESTIRKDIIMLTVVAIILFVVSGVIRITITVFLNQGLAVSTFVARQHVLVRNYGPVFAN